MEWQTVGTVVTSKDYVLTPVVAGTLFKLKHFTQSQNRGSLKIAIRQAFEDNESLALFDYKLINCKVEQDILLFNLPQGLISRKLAFKRVDNLIDNWTIEIQTLVIETTNMPSYPSLPIFSGITKNVTESNIVVGNTPSLNLSSYNPTKIGTTLTNLSEFNLYVSVGVNASLTVYDKILGINEVFETPFNWCGDVYAIADIPEGATTNALVKVKNFYQ